jgi:hypothetical protein
VVSVTDPYGRILAFLEEELLFLPSSSSVVLTRLEWTPFHTHYVSENLVASGIKYGPLNL